MAQDIQDLNRLVLSMGEKFRAEIVQPIGPSPSRLPVKQSFSLAVTDAFWRLPRLVGERRPSPETIARRGQRLGDPVSPLSIWMLGYFFLVGREVVLDVATEAAAAREHDSAEILAFWRRLSATHRGDGHLDNSDAGLTNRFLPRALVEQLYQGLAPADLEMRRLAEQFCATLETYLFGLNAEAHLGIADSGPYPLSTDRVLVVRDFFDLKGRFYPWRETVADLPYASCSLAFTLDPGDFQSIGIRDRAALLTSPRDYLRRLREIALVTHDSGRPHFLPFTEMARLVRSTKKLQPRLGDWFARLSRHDAIVQAARPWAVRPVSVIGRAEDCFDWQPEPEALGLLPLYADDDARAVRWASHRCLVPGRPSFVPLSEQMFQHGEGRVDSSEW